MSQQTAVEFLVNELNFILQLDDSEWDEVYEAAEQAKAMEKKKMEDAWEDGQDSFTPRTFEEYYNENYKN
jgi:hypothetical protein